MKKFSKYLFISIFLIVVFSISIPVLVNATEFDLVYPEFTNQGEPAGFVREFYIYALGISGTLAVIMIVYGGVKYIASAGNTSAQSEARDIIKSSVYGILLLGGAVLILNTINPEITKLESFNIEKVPSINQGTNQGTGGN